MYPLRKRKYNYLKHENERCALVKAARKAAEKEKSLLEEQNAQQLNKMTGPAVVVRSFTIHGNGLFSAEFISVR